MSPYEEELQKKLESGGFAGDGLDAKAYQEVFRALKELPAYEPAPGFASRVVARAVRKQRSRSFKDYFWFGAGIFFLLMTAIATIMFTGFRLDFGFLSIMSDYKGLAVFGIVFVLLLHLLDKRLVQGRTR